MNSTTASSKLENCPSFVRDMGKEIRFLLYVLLVNQLCK